MALVLGFLVAVGEGFGLAGAGEWEGYEDVPGEREFGELAFFGGGGFFVRVEAPFYGVDAVDFSAVAGCGCEGEVAGFEERD